VFYAKNVPFSYDEKAEGLLDSDAAPVLKALLEGFEALCTLNEDSIKELCKDVAKDHAEGKMGKVGMPLRAAITGTTVSPSIFEACAILGKEETCARLKAAIDCIENNGTMQKTG
jgi:glutamyl-tRNA synthetase